MSNRSGSGKVAGSRFAAARNSRRGCPAGQATLHVGIGAGRDAGEGGRGDQPQHFFHSGGPADGVVLQGRPRAGVGAQQVGAQGQQGGGGLVPGEDEEDAVRDQVLAVFSVGVPGGQGGHQVIGWLLRRAGRAARRSRRAAAGRVVGGLHGDAVAVPLAGEAAHEDDQRLAEPVPVRGRDAQHIADHRERQRPGEIGDQVHAPRGGHLVDERGSTLGDDRPVTPTRRAVNRPLKASRTRRCRSPSSRIIHRRSNWNAGSGEGGMVGAAKRGSRSTSRTNRYWQPGSGEPRKITCGSARPAGENSAPSRSNSVVAPAAGLGGVLMRCTLARPAVNADSAVCAPAARQREDE